jgi:type VI secretion system protein ImpE
MNAQLLYQNGQLVEAIQALSAGLRDDPTAVRERTFLFELLCFAGEYDRAEKQLNLIAQSSREAEIGSLLYRSALHAERLRQEMFLAKAPVPGGVAPTAVSGTLNGDPFTSIADADPRIGARLEIYAAGQYTWIPFAQLASVSAESPQRLRDLLWIPTRVRTGPDYSDLEIGEVMVPALTPLAWQHPDPEVRLGRMTDWQELPDGSEIPVGQKLLRVDDELIPILEVRQLEISSAT